MARSSARLRLLCAILVGGSWVACASSDADTSLGNPSFDDWCDRHLCDWTTDQGRIESTRTWHEKDLAVSFLETPTKISQLLKLDGQQARCLLFDTIADVALEADVSLEIDFNDDGIPDDRRPIPVLRWQSVPFIVHTPIAYKGLRLSVIKSGTGRAVLAQMRVVPQPSCSGAPFTLAEDSVCSEDAVCTSGHCQDGHCQPCADRNCPPLTPAASSE